ncbi:MAG: Phenylalanine--tRNA ligase alpha subunit [Thermotoga sp. 50_1627]|uniref:phenylalanine--tRNA ligase subunit alpha n=1 Tax=Pseudothermotoga sp. TaxID=2033661 RepID=UPI00076D0DD3|nr:MAG: Phenylalanine--tRNA ligase alpha subunit [Thermotoga sp. 50_64]KUK25464.1 MAG: Phenylalanine--tRNA ligase alpha subunit [Thermotoga sp. 50_1627]MBC7115739.1 phenylalanine--tRNA ligase subunit alpha [Pseudothermotoga sp.]HBT38997.1 phenylalanine--tRNA ligase subunit alpha [Pseudothermotoga sp.]HCO97721.1 phenylalanine--tRNA ligase subunit alpha [Pseudothermotoga sp.]
MFEEMKERVLKEINDAQDVAQLEKIRVNYLGKKGILTEQMRSIGKLPPEERPKVGQVLNELKETIERALEERKRVLEATEEERRLQRLWIDVTLPGAIRKVGHPHPISKVLEEIETIFVSMGFKVVEGPEIEDSWHNFDALNTPEWHPARDMHDSFYLQDRLLRTHTSPVQIRTMLSEQPPIAIISPGRVYRRDYDATHLPMFTQVEGLYVDEHVSVAHLKYTLEIFAKRMFGPERKIRLRPSYFPFTEPSFEVDVSCGICMGKGCPSCKYTGWLEILGAGMVHPNVFRNVGYDPEKYTGFAFGMGVERIAMLKYGIKDIRDFVRNDERFLECF